MFNPHNSDGERRKLTADLWPLCMYHSECVLPHPTPTPTPPSESQTQRPCAWFLGPSTFLSLIDLLWYRIHRALYGSPWPEWTGLLLRICGHASGEVPPQNKTVYSSYMGSWMRMFTLNTPVYCWGFSEGWKAIWFTDLLSGKWQHQSSWVWRTLLSAPAPLPSGELVFGSCIAALKVL